MLQNREIFVSFDLDRGFRDLSSKSFVLLFSVRRTLKNGLTDEEKQILSSYIKIYWRSKTAAYFKAFSGSSNFKEGYNRSN